MLPIFIVLAGLGLGLLYSPSWSAPWFDARVSLIAVPALVAVQLAASRLVVRVASRKPADGNWEDYVRALLRAAAVYRLLAVPLYAAAVYVFNWPLVVARTLRLDGVPFAETAAVLAPFIALVLVSFVGLHAAESVARRERLPLREYLLFQVRSGLALPLLPALGIFTVFEALHASERVATFLAVYPFFYWIILLSLAFAFVSTAPTVLARLWNAQPFPEGPLHERLKLLCDQAGVPRPRFCVWPTRGFGHINAAVVGLFSSNRIVLFTDAMLSTFTPDEVSAVLAHELGHARHRHLVTYFTLAAGAALFVTFGDFALQSAASETLRLAAALAFLAAFAGGAVGFYSRRFERQADLFAARLVPAALYIATLEKVAALSGNVRKIWFFTHMSIEMRVNFLLEAAVRPESAALFERNLRRAVVGVVAFAAFSLGGALYTVARQVEEAPSARQRLEAASLERRAARAWDAGDRARAIELAREATAKDAAAGLTLGEFLFASGKAFEAEEPYRAALQAWGKESDEGRKIVERLAVIEGMKERRK